MAKYVLCPRCELNYIQEGEEYCDVCKAELKKGPQLVFAVDEDEQETMELCPKCRQNYLKLGEDVCEECAKKHRYEAEADNDIDENDEGWKDFMDDTEEDGDKEEDEAMLSLSRLVEEEGDELFDDEEEEDDLVSDSVEPDDFEIPDIDESDFEDDEEEDEEDDDEDEEDF